MKLPKIQEDQHTLRNGYINSILNKPVKKYKTDKLSFDWQSGETKLVVLVPEDEDLIQSLIQLQSACQKQSIPHFYSYFFVDHLIHQYIKLQQSGESTTSNRLVNKSQMIQTVKTEVQEIKNKRSKWNLIEQLIQLRQTLVSRIDNQVSNNRLQTVYTYLDDIRFINFQIVKKVQQWSQSMKTDSQVQPFFIHDGNNYLVKIINDNTNVINVLNSKSVKFLSPPNPFYLSRDGNKASMSQTQQTDIDSCMQILAKNKAQELKMLINPPSFANQSMSDTNISKKKRSQIELQKAEKIRNVYKSVNFANNSAVNLRGSLYASSSKPKNDIIQKPITRQKPIFSVDKTKNEQKFQNLRLGKLIQQKQAALMKNITKQEFRQKDNRQKLKNQEKQSQQKNGNKYLSKIDSLRKSIQQNKIISNTKLNPINPINTVIQNQAKQSKAENLMRLSTISNKSQLPKTVAQIKAPKPKIRLIMEKQSIIEDVVKAFLPAATQQQYTSMNVRKSASSFFKQQKSQQKAKQKQKQKQKQQLNIADIKPITQHSRTLSASSKTYTNFLQTYSKSKNKNKNTNKNNKSNTKSELSLSNQNISPGKGSKPSLMDSKVSSPQAQLRVLNSKLRQQTIMSIYGKKMRVNLPASESPYVPLQRSQKQLRKQQIDQQLKIVKNRLKDLTTNKPFDRKRSSQAQLDFKRETFHKEEVSLVQKQKAIKKQNMNNQKILEQNQTQKQNLLVNLQQKDKKIAQLLAMLKKQENVDIQDKKATSEKIEQQNNLKMQKQKKLKQIEKLQSQIKNENIRIKQQMEQEQRKFIQLKQKQYQMKEQQMVKKHAQDMQQMRQQYTKKNKELQAKIMQQQRIRKQNQIRILQQQRQMQQLKMQMQQKRLKEQLLQQILKQHREKQDKEQQYMKQDQLLRREKLKREIMEKEQMERKMLENIQEDNRKLHQMFQAMKRKNQQAEKQNQRKMVMLRRFEDQAKQEQQNLKRLQAELQQAKRVLQPELEITQKQQQQQAYGVHDMQQVRLKVKQQILREMMAKKQEQEQEYKMEQQQRSRKLAEIQQQIRKQLRRQEQQMERIQKQERQKYERVKKQLEDQHEKKMKQIQSQIKKQEQAQHNQKDTQLKQQQQKKAIEKQQDKQQQKNQQLYDYGSNQISHQQYEKELKRSLEQAEKRKEQQKMQALIAENMKQWDDPKDNKPEKLDKSQHKSEIKQEIKDIQKSQANQNSKVLQDQSQQSHQKLRTQSSILGLFSPRANTEGQIQKIQNKVDKDTTAKKQVQQSSPGQKDPKLIETQKSIVNTNKQSTVQQQKPATKKQTVKQLTDQILTKYQNLQPYLSKCKQIFISDTQLHNFLSSFYSQFAVQVRQMLPYSAEDISKAVASMQRKIDIYQGSNGHSIGWIEEQRYILLGNISCVENIVRKYGQTQIQMTYIFNKSNAYQKQYLAKQVKIFDKVGFIFQKKLKEQNMFSIKLIIKIPQQILPKNFKSPTNQVTIKSKISADLIAKSPQQLQNKKYAYGYLLSQTLKHCLSGDEEIAFKQDKTQQSRIIQKKMHYKTYNDNLFKSQQIDDKKLQVEVKLNFKFLQMQQHPCFVIKCEQYKNIQTNNGDAIYKAKINANLSAIIFAYDKSCETFSMDLLLNIKTSKLQKQRDLLLYLPIWHKKQQLKINNIGPKQFTFNYSIDPNLTSGSVISTNVLKQQYKYIESPFVFSIWETSELGVLLRPLLGETVQAKDLVTHKK